MRTFTRTLLLFSLLAAVAGRAHDADVVYVLVRTPGGETPGLAETVTMTAGTLGLLAPIDANADGVLDQSDLDARAASLGAGVWDDMPLTAGNVACARTGERSWLREGFIELEARFACGPGELRQDFRFLRVLPTNYRVVLGSQLDGERNRAFAQGTFTSLIIPRPSPPGWWSSASFWAALTDGLRRGFALSAAAAMLALGLSLASWRRLALAVVPLLLGLFAASFVRLPFFAGPAALTLTALGLAVLRREAHVTVGAIIGLGVGASGGTGELARAVGLALGSCAVCVPWLVAAVVLGRLAAPRGRLAQAKWLAAGLSVLGLGLAVVSN